MSRLSRADAKVAPPLQLMAPALRAKATMTSFVESCLTTAAGPVAAAARTTRDRPRVRKLLRALEGKKNILITTHQYPDPDALASSLALQSLLQLKLKDAQVVLSVKKLMSGGLNAAFSQESAFTATPWNEETLNQYDAVILLDTQPGFKFSPLPAGIIPTAVIDHHRVRGSRPKCAFCDVRTDVGATSSIVFSYFMELQAEIKPDLAAMLLYAIETDLAGAAGQPGELDNVALSSLTLHADTRKLYKMRYVDLPQSYYTAYSRGLANAVYHDTVLISHIGDIESPEQPAVIADFLLRFEQVQTVLVSAVINQSIVVSLRTSSGKVSAADIMRRLLKKIGEGGGHKSKAGGIIPLETGSATEIERVRSTLRRRVLRAMRIKMGRGTRLVKAE